MFLGSNNFTFILIAVLFLFHLIFIFYIWLMYRNMIMPTPFQNNSSNNKMQAIEIAEKYLIQNNITSLELKYNLKNYSIDKIYQNKILLINDLSINNVNLSLTGLGIDYVLGKVFFGSELFKKNSTIKSIRFWLFQAPKLFLLLFYFFILLNIIFVIIVNVKPSILENEIINIINKYQLISLFPILMGGLYLVSLAMSPKLKENLENLYESKMKNFVREEFPDFFGDWLNARLYARSNRFTYLVGYNFFFKYNYKYTGPFGL
ncbi:hypothetical protein [Spiroplasma chrysopicola]|uniref:Transmembrane protein n=1 Tax=Spiroplasma chrysopicola DF-1 TaxID=1276227 RepID=R4U3F8_9MOLU|nr:hypothetical protein [Spiroplasma chrysopicola]AGM25033.1 hypothetical protein SCHRY_v1c04520 [Spiroplasma chrysopicola DF-1]